MSYDLFFEFRAIDPASFESLLKRLGSVPDVQSRVKLLASALPLPDDVRNKAKDNHKCLVSGMGNGGPDYVCKLIDAQTRQLKGLGMWAPEPTDLSALPLPPYSLFLQFPFTLARPYLSRDDEVFHICDNPVRKDKVFKLPMVSASTWKGNLRQAAVRALVKEWEATKDVAALADRRFHLTLLFGDEKGEEVDEKKAMARYLDELSSEAASEYRKEVRERFPAEDGEQLPHHGGQLRFFPTFFDSIGMEVINPHNRRTKAGTKPIPFESVPIGAHGVFSLLYVPLVYLGTAEQEMKRNVSQDLDILCEAVEGMMLTYGFSAKKKAGFGLVKPELGATGYPESVFRVKGLKLAGRKLGNFGELKARFQEAKLALAVKQGKNGQG